ncbi:MAG: glycosyltransferase family 39 protein [Solirubrobacteraceae bacterium]
MATTARSAGGTTGRLPARIRSSWLASADAQILLAIVIVGAVARFATLSNQSYWLDEATTVHELGLSFGAMLHSWSSVEADPPLYFLIAWPWSRVFGLGEAGVRSLSAVFGTALIPVLYLAGRELVSRRAGLVAAGLAAINPFLIWYSQDAHEYMLMALLCTASLLFFARCWHRGSRRDLIWWAAFSALTLSTMYFAGLLVFAEGALLVYRRRDRASLLALVSQVIVLGVWVPHLIPQLRNPQQWVTGQPLSIRLQQVPITFALNTLYQGPIVHYGLVAAAVAAVIVLGLLLTGADDRELRGAGLAALLAAVVIVVPLVAALIGSDGFIARALMPAWPPLAIVVAAACTARRARIPGAALAVVFAGLFVWSGLKIDSDSVYQRPDWRAVAAALGTAHGTRAIVAYAGQFATAPLSLYLPGTPWAGAGAPPGVGTGPVTISELDIVGSVEEDLSPLPPGVRLISSHTVNIYRVVRLALDTRWQTDTAAIGARAVTILGPVPPGLAVMIQRAAP